MKSLSRKIWVWVMNKFLTEIVSFWTHHLKKKLRNLLSKFLVQLAGQIYENFLQNILVGTHFEILRKFSEIWEFGQNYENFYDFFVGRIKLWTPWFSDSWEKNIVLGQNRGFAFYEFTLYNTDPYINFLNPKAYINWYKLIPDSR